MLPAVAHQDLLDLRVLQVGLVEGMAMLLQTSL